MAKLAPPVVSDAIYGVVNNAYTFDILGRDKFGRPAHLVNTSPRDSFYSMIEQWSFSMPLKSQWFLYIEKIPRKVSEQYLSKLEYSGLLNRDVRRSDKSRPMNQLIDKFAYAGGFGGSNLPTQISFKKKKPENILDKISNRLDEVSSVFSGETSISEFLGKDIKPTSGGGGSLFGCRFVDSVSGLPGESSNYSYVGPEITGGYHGGYVSQGRNEYTELTINFKETNSSLVDFVFRPWVQMIQHEGLIANFDPNDDLVTVINIVEYARSVNNKPSPARKQWVLFEAAPIKVADDALTYENDGTWPVKAVSFKYTNALVLDYDRFDDVMKYKAPSGPSLLSRFIPGAVNSAIDAISGQSGTTNSFLSENSPI